MDVFLGGTIGNKLKSEWRKDLIAKLDPAVDYFDPEVPVWTKAAQEQERMVRRNAKYVVYVITPLMEGSYSIAEVVEDAIKRPAKTIFYVLPTDKGVRFKLPQMKSLWAVANLVKRNKARVMDSLDEIADFLNKRLG